jgi:hypothetical protein
MADVNLNVINQNGVVEPRRVEVFIKFIRIGEIDTMNEKYHSEIRVESKWVDDEIIVEYDKAKHWNPLLDIENSLKELKEIQYDLLIENGVTLVTEIRKFKADLWERLELQHFPFDVQELNLTLFTRRSFKEVKIVPSDVKSYINSGAKNRFIEQQKW